MSVACRSWDVATCPVVGYNMSVQGSMCATADALTPETPIYSSNTLVSPESFLKGVGAGTDVPKGFTFPNHKTVMPQETVIRGFSSLSLHPQLQLQVGSPSEDRKTTTSGESSKPLELNCRVPLGSNGRNFYCFAAPSAGCEMQERVESVPDGCRLLPHSGSSDTQCSTSPNTFWVATRNLVPLYDNYGNFDFYDFPKHTLDVVVEDKPFEENSTVTGKDDLELGDLSASSTSSVSSLFDSPVDGSVSSGEGLCGVGESEVESVFKGLPTFPGVSSPPRKGLSRFYAGKSRSFSCLADVMSLKDLAKPENPYARKRRYHVGRSLNAGRPQLPPLQKGAAGICKKALPNGKSTLALAVAMNTREDIDVDKKGDTSFVGAQMSWQESPLTSRSFSLSDLQRATESRVSPC